MSLVSAKHFWELPADTLHGTCIVLDIDGTLVVASSAHAHPGVHETVQKLKQHNDVVLFSNNALDHSRNIDLAAKLSIPYVATWWRKPMPFVLRAVQNPKHLPVVIIGDLFLTDGLFALITGSRFIRIARCVSPHESRLWWLLLYSLDDMLMSSFGKFLFPVQKI